MESSENKAPLGLSASLARYFLTSRLTLLIVIASLCLGVFAFSITPREEEPQVSRTIVDVVIPFPGANPKSVELMVVNPAEQLLSSIPGLEHIVSIAESGGAFISLLFETGVSKVDALVHTHNVIESNKEWVPLELGVLDPIVTSKDNDDIVVFSLLLHADDDSVDLDALRSIANSIENEFKRVPGTREVETVGGNPRTITISVDSDRIHAHDITIDEIQAAVQAANHRSIAGDLVRSNSSIEVSVGEYFGDLTALDQLVLKIIDGKSVSLGQIADINYSVAHPNHYIWYGAVETIAGEDNKDGFSEHRLERGSEQPAVIVTVTKKAGENVSELVAQLEQRVSELRNTLIPTNVSSTVVRNYGQVADDKIQLLMKKISLLVISVALLIFFALGRRESMVVLAVLLITLSLTFFATYLLGFTLNRSSLFAMIVSIGLLADDAVVVIENIHRHRSSAPDRKLAELIPRAVHEIGGATVLATFAVVVALMPLAFLSGVVGEYFRPVPVITSIGMIISLVIAFVVCPWLASLWMRSSNSPTTDVPEGKTIAARLAPLFTNSFSPLLDDHKGSRNRRLLCLLIVGAMIVAIAAPVLQWVPFRLQPLDSKSEIFVVLDMPAGSPLERTAAVARAMTDVIGGVDEVKDYQVYVGTAAPVDPTGLVRKYYLRNQPKQAQILINLVDRSKRKKKSGAVVEDIRQRIKSIALNAGADFTVYDPPSGLPLPALVVAEIYGPSEKERAVIEASIREKFEQVEGLVDINSSSKASIEQISLVVDQSKAKLAGIAVEDIASTLSTALHGRSITFLHAGSKYPSPVNLQLASDKQGDLRSLLSISLRGENAQLVPLSELVNVELLESAQQIFHKDLLPYHFVTAEVNSKIRSPIWAVNNIGNDFHEIAVQGGGQLTQNFTSEPIEPFKQYSVKWDGEWSLTYDTISEMGAAYIVGLFLVYVLIVAKFGSYLVPLIIMVPIPLTLIGQIFGHYILDTEATVTSVIGMLVLAGLIVRNSILLVDFIQVRRSSGVPLQQAVVESANIRAQPIILTSLTAMVAALFLLDDPVFNGLAVALIFGNLVSTALTLIVIPTMYYALFHRAELQD